MTENTVVFPIFYFFLFFLGSTLFHFYYAPMCSFRNFAIKIVKIILTINLASLSPFLIHGHSEVMPISNGNGMLPIL